MEFSKIHAPSLKELFVQELENMIISGKLEIGTQLPPERELAQTMRVSRSVVNSGINELASKGFLEIRPRIGAFVADYRRNGTVETLLSIMKYNGGKLQKDEIRSILEIKVVLDRLLVQLTIPKITDKQIIQLKEHAEQLRDAATLGKAVEAVFNFHHELALISGNTLVPLIYYSFRAPIMSLWERYCRKHGIKALYHNTSKLFEAIEKRDLNAAVGCIEESIGDSISGSTQIYSE